MNLFLKVNLLLFIVLANTPLAMAKDADETSAQVFFETYQTLFKTFDEKVVALYDENAEITMTRTYPSQPKRELRLTGAQWRPLLAASLPAAKTRNDVSTFSNVVITIDGDLATIKADRYASMKCYTDTGYQLKIRRADDGTYAIVAEHTNTLAQSNCE